MPSSSTAESVERALAAEDVEALSALAKAQDRQVSKAAKRALYLLRARGIRPPAPEAGEPKSDPGPERPAESREAARVSTIDGRGDRILFVPLKAPRGFELHVTVLSELRGVIDSTSLPLSRRQVRAYFAELPPETREILREVPLPRAAALLRQGLARSQETEATSRARGLLRSLPSGEAEPPAPGGDVPQDSVQALQQALQESAALLTTPALRGYLPPEGLVLSLGQKLEEVRLSPLLIDGAQRLAQLRHTLERAEEEYFGAEQRALYGARLLDAAELFAARHDEVGAVRARAAGAALLAGRPIHEIPFARAMFERLFDLERLVAEESTRAASQPNPGGLKAPRPGDLIGPR